MRLLLDESLPRQLKNDLMMHQVTTVVERGWSGIKNGHLLALAASEFDAFITADQNLPYQQNPSRLAITVIVLAANNNRLPTLRTLIPQLQITLANLPLNRMITITI